MNAIRIAFREVMASDERTPARVMEVIAAPISSKDVPVTDAEEATSPIPWASSSNEMTPLTTTPNNRSDTRPASPADIPYEFSTETIALLATAVDDKPATPAWLDSSSTFIASLAAMPDDRISYSPLAKLSVDSPNRTDISRMPEVKP